eukprot:GILI01010324.1.p1 GENE.GILI01010324.1~~GILI01010324.1.p1  ORF type:complete len:356 (+),score=41.23 GILI01010324.1:89-1156(+)
MDAILFPAEEEPEYVPHFALPITANNLPEYANKEQEIIQQCFRSGNYTYLSKLPDEISPESINTVRHSQMLQNRTMKPEPKPWPKMQQLSGGGFFQAFEYSPSPYSAEADEEKRLKQESEDKRRHISEKDFISGPFGSTASKFEDPFLPPASALASASFSGSLGSKGSGGEMSSKLSPRTSEEYRYPYLGDVYGAAQDQALRTKWLQESKILSGPFMAGGPKAVGKVIRLQLPDIVTGLSKIIKEDWEDSKFSVIATAEDLIDIRFEVATVDSVEGLSAYMNVLEKSNPFLTENLLRRCTQSWGLQDGGWLVFTLIPPWVHVRVTDAFYSLHPQGTRSPSSSTSSAFASSSPSRR